MLARLSSLLLPALIGAGFAVSARAQEVTPARCEAVLQALQNAASQGGSTLQARYSGLTDGACEYSDVAMAGESRYAPVVFADKVVIAGSALNWVSDGSVKSADLTLTAEAIRLTARSGDARMDYLLQAQARQGEMAFELRGNWDGAKKELRVGLFDLQIGDSSRVKFGALVKNIDISTPGAAQMALTGAALSELDLELKSFGFFEQFLLPMLISRLPDSGGSDGDSEAGFARVVAEKKLELRTAINQLPDAAFPAPSRAALAALLSDLPNPRGKLVVGFRSASGFGAARFARFALAGMPKTMKELAPLFDDTRFVIDWRRGDRS
ncbi:hypothetical protein [Pseudogemmobacter bohemicus]|uniref:hypothetical protein n=1 Tax=Pseudogemmobacter bohemicus TaxID=2250708 RepID=UPI000DD4ADFA|nr:hypothetical protein [Pseudogemmobacter bohemicus]